MVGCTTRSEDDGGGRCFNVLPCGEMCHTSSGGALHPSLMDGVRLQECSGTPRDGVTGRTTQGRGNRLVTFNDVFSVEASFCLCSATGGKQCQLPRMHPHIHAQRHNSHECKQIIQPNKSLKHTTEENYTDSTLSREPTARAQSVQCVCAHKACGRQSRPRRDAGQHTQGQRTGQSLG